MPTALILGASRTRNGTNSNPAWIPGSRARFVADRLDDKIQERVAGFGELMRRAVGNDDHITLFEVVGITARDRCAAKLAGRDYFAINHRAAGHESRGAIHYVDYIGLLRVQ